MLSGKGETGPDLKALRAKVGLQALALSRATAVHKRHKISQNDLALKWCLDEAHIDHRFFGNRLLRDILRRQGHGVGRKHVATIKKKMDSGALYEKHGTRRCPLQQSACS